MKEIEIHQCLFGYENGHRLLASSMKLPSDVASTLLLLSDLAPGLMLSSSEGYWTGTPHPSAKVYALMYTWVASEMPRPGCVWSHVLLIPFPEMARLQDLSILFSYISRPNFNFGFDTYKNSILLNSKISDDISKKKVINSESIKTIINAAYKLNGKVQIESSIGHLDDAIFCVWSQQWPRLRRSFSFRTASSSHEIATDKTKFDISIIQPSIKNAINTTAESLKKSNDWEEHAINDALSSEITIFRRYLWRYGSDIISGRKSFKNISVIYPNTFDNQLIGERLFLLLRKLIEYFPSINEAKTLKSDIILGGKYSYFPPVNKMDLLFFYIKNNIQTSLPPLTNDVFLTIISDWNSRENDILIIGEICAEKNIQEYNKALEIILSQAKSDGFFSWTKNTPKLRNHLLLNNPSLMDNNELVTVTIGELLDYIELIPRNNIALASSILQKLLVINNDDLVLKMSENFNKITINTVILAFEKLCLNKYSEIGNSWLSVINNSPKLIIDGGYILNSKSTLALHKYFSILKQSDLLSLINTKDWSLCLKNSVDNIAGEDRIELVLYLFRLGLNYPNKDSEVIFEKFFEEVHGYFEHSTLSYSQSEIFLEKLPRLGLFSNWDNCQRLRVAIVNAYIYNDLTTASFKRLTRRKDLYSELIDTLSESNEGKRFINSLI